MPSHISRYFLNEDLADVHFVFDNENGESHTSIPAHVFVLSSASDVFHTQFHGSIQAGDQVRITDAEPEVFKALLQFVYTEHADISRLDELAPDNGKVFELLYLAKKYLLEELVGYIVSYFVAILSVPNVFSVFRHSHFFDNGFLVEFWDYVDRHAEELMNSEQFLTLDLDTVRDIVMRDTLSINRETVVYKRLIDWGEEQYTRKYKNRVKTRGAAVSTGARELLEDVFYLIRFPQMSGHEFAAGPAREKHLTKKEKLDIFRSISGSGTASMAFVNRPRRIIALEGSFAARIASLTRSQPDEDISVVFQAPPPHPLSSSSLFWS